MLHLTVHHIGYLVKNIEKSAAAFQSLGYQTETAIIYDDIRKIDICFLIKDQYRIELVSPTSEDSVVAGLIKKYKNSPYHICYESQDFDKDISYLASNGYCVIGEPTKAPAISDRKVVFLMHSQHGMIELLDMH